MRSRRKSTNKRVKKSVRKSKKSRSKRVGRRITKSRKSRSKRVGRSKSRKNSVKRPVRRSLSRFSFYGERFFVNKDNLKKDLEKYYGNKYPLNKGDKEQGPLEKYYKNKHDEDKLALENIDLDTDSVIIALRKIRKEDDVCIESIYSYTYRKFYGKKPEELKSYILKILECRKKLWFIILNKKRKLDGRYQENKKSLKSKLIKEDSYEPQTQYLMSAFPEDMEEYFKETPPNPIWQYCLFNNTKEEDIKMYLHQYKNISHHSDRSKIDLEGQDLIPNNNYYNVGWIWYDIERLLQTVYCAYILTKDPNLNEKVLIAEGKQSKSEDKSQLSQEELIEEGYKCKLKDKIKSLGLVHGNYFKSCYNPRNQFSTTSNTGEFIGYTIASQMTDGGISGF